jgi:hypothetical protein
MLKQETIQKIEQLLKIKGLAEAIRSEGEVDLSISEDLTVYSEEEVKTLKSNSYKEGKRAGVEMEVDDLKKELGLDFQGKTVKGLVEASQKKALQDAKVEPEKKVQELSEKISTLQKTVQEQEKAIQAKDQEVTGVKINGELYKHIPQFGEGAPALAADEVITLMKANGYEFRLEEGRLVPYKNGQPLQDKTANPLEAKDVVTGFLQEKKLLIPDAPPVSGRGGGDRKPPARAGRLSELKKTFSEQGKSLQGEEFYKAVDQALKDNPEFDMNS